METKISLLQMMNLLRLVEKEDSFFFSLATASLVLDMDDFNDVKNNLAYYIKNEMIEHIGEDIYAFRIFSMVPINAHELLVHALRPNEINYVSFELLLNEYGIISQIPTVFTVATTGKSGLYRSRAYGIEFTHVDHSYNEIIENCFFDESRGILEASPIFAVNDLLTVNRNTHLIQEEEIEDAQEWYENQQR